MNYLIWAVCLIGIQSTAVVLGTDMFYARNRRCT